MRAILFGLVPSMALGLDLTPKPDVKVLEGGFKVPVLTFADKKKPVRWMPPEGWRVTHESGVLTLSDPDRTHAGMELRVVPKTNGDLATFASAEALQKYCAAFFPKTATEITYTGTNAGPFTIGQAPAREYLFKFTEPGHPTLASVSLVDISETERLAMIVSAQPKDFEKIREAAVASMFSWTTDW